MLIWNRRSEMFTIVPSAVRGARVPRRLGNAEQPQNFWPTFIPAVARRSTIGLLLPPFAPVSRRSTLPSDLRSGCLQKKQRPLNETLGAPSALRANLTGLLLRSLTSSSPTHHQSVMILLMSAEASEFTSEQVKAWVISRNPLHWGFPMRDQIVLALQDLGFERIRVTKVIHHPVRNISAQADNSAPTACDP